MGNLGGGGTAAAGFQLGQILSVVRRLPPKIDPHAHTCGGHLLLPGPDICTCWLLAAAVLAR